VTDQRPGIRRVKHGKTFRYLHPNGRKVGGKSETFRRIQALVLPPAWTDVWISPVPNGHIQATGWDARGRKQYRYHDLWRKRRDAQKFARLAKFAYSLPRVRAKIKRALRFPGISREKVLATVVRLLDTTLIRVGNEEYAQENHSYGLTTFRNRHARIRGSAVEFSFHGKSGKNHHIKIKDRKLSKIIHRCQELPGQDLFEYLDQDGQTHPIGSRDVNEFIHALAGKDDFTAKDFRTWHGTVLAVEALYALNAKRIGQRNIVRIVKAVAEALGNTPAVCRKSYIHPGIFEAALPLSPAPDSPAGLSAPERRTLALLKKLR